MITLELDIADKRLQLWMRLCIIRSLSYGLLWWLPWNLILLTKDSNSECVFASLDPSAMAFCGDYLEAWYCWQGTPTLNASLHHQILQRLSSETFQSSSFPDNSSSSPSYPWGNARSRQRFKPKSISVCQSVDPSAMLLFQLYKNNSNRRSNNNQYWDWKTRNSRRTPDLKTLRIK